MLECCGLCKSYGRTEVVKDVDLLLPEGKILGLLGPNGAGKSTLIKMITGLVWPSGGNASINGYDVHNEHERALQDVGAIVEWPSLFPYLTARENLKLIVGRRDKEFNNMIEEVSRFVDMSSVLDKKVGTFSTGMKQRIGLTLAMLPASRFLILDEPTNGLDPGGMIELRQILKRIHAERGATIMISSHLLGEVEQICTDVAILHQGRIVANKPLADFTEQRGTLIFQATPLEKAKEVFKQAAQSLPITNMRTEQTKGEISFLVDADHNLVSEVNRLLINAGCAVSHASFKRRHLEDVFTELTTDSYQKYDSAILPQETLHVD